MRCRIDVVEVGFQDADQVVFVLVLADEVFKFVSECLDFFVACVFAHGSNVVVQQLRYGGIVLEEFLVFHVSLILLWSVIGMVR